MDERTENVKTVYPTHSHKHSLWGEGRRGGINIFTLLYPTTIIPHHTIVVGYYVSRWTSVCRSIRSSVVRPSISVFGSRMITWTACSVSHMSVCPYLFFQMITWVNINGFSPNLVCAWILWSSSLGLLMGKFRQILTALSAQDMLIFSFPDDNLSKRQWIFTKLGMCIDIVEIWFGIASGQISLSAQDTPIFSFPDNNLSKCNGILTKLGTCIDMKEIWFGIANGQILPMFYRVICLWHNNGGVLLTFLYWLLFPGCLFTKLLCDMASV